MRPSPSESMPATPIRPMKSCGIKSSSTYYRCRPMARRRSTIASSTTFATSTPLRRIDPRRRDAYWTALSWGRLSMQSIDDRERDSRNQAAADEALELKATVQRNRLLGLWAGELMGLEDQHLED